MTYKQEKIKPYAEEGAKGAQVEKMFDSIADDGTYDPLGLQKMKGVVSGSGKYVMLYKADSSFDYSKIEKEEIKLDIANARKEVKDYGRKADN